MAAPTAKYKARKSKKSGTKPSFEPEKESPVTDAVEDAEQCVLGEDEELEKSICLCLLYIPDDSSTIRIFTMFFNMFYVG